MLEWIRSRLLIRAGIEFNTKLSHLVLYENLYNTPSSNASKDSGNIRDVQVLRNFLGSSAVFAFFDIPWMPIYFILIFILHPALGVTAFTGGVVVVLIGLYTQKITSKDLDNANIINSSSSMFLNSALRNASIVKSMGMIENIITRWNKLNDEVIELQTRASRSAGLLQSANKALRIGLQVLIYAVGAYLTVIHETTPGVMIAASIVMGRALAPIDQAMATYKLSAEAKDAYRKLEKTLDSSFFPSSMPLPAPNGEIATENLVFSMQGRNIIRNVTFKVNAGDSLAIIGPSASGKSSLCRLLLGLWKPQAGKVRIDDADISVWNSEKLGTYVGYLPQDVELFAGSVAENISRMGTVEPEAVIQAATVAGVHKLILNLQNGYDTQIGEHGSALSGGQRQRIGLARALYGSPRIVILDEPNSNLDEEGEICLEQTISNLKKNNSTVIIVTHKKSILSTVDKVLLMHEGQVIVCGTRQEVMAKQAILQKQAQLIKQQQEDARKREEALRSIESN